MKLNCDWFWINSFSKNFMLYYSESKVKVPNSSLEIGNSEIQEIFEWEETGQFTSANKSKQKEALKYQVEWNKPKTKSQLSLKSKAYMKPGTM